MVKEMRLWWAEKQLDVERLWWGLGKSLSPSHPEELGESLTLLLLCLSLVLQKYPGSKDCSRLFCSHCL